MKHLIFCFLGLLMIACSSGSVEEREDELTGIAVFFPKFPEKHYKSLTLGDSIQKIEYHLGDEGYEEQVDNPFHYKNNNWQTEVILPDTDIIFEFKVFIYNEKYLTKANEFEEFFEQRAIESSFGEAFSVFSFVSKKRDFQVTLFEQPEFIRLHYELKSSH